jgi:hypothetical protein
MLVSAQTGVRMASENKLISDFITAIFNYRRLQTAENAGEL